MTRQISLGTMIIQISGLLGTDDLSTWEETFISDITEKTHGGKVTGTLSDKQITAVEKIFIKHFA